jgi:hypothetical protein
MTSNRQRAIRNTLDQLGMQAKPEQVVEALESHGLDVSDRFVSLVKMQMLRYEAKAAREGFKRPPKLKTRYRPQRRKIPPRRQ